MSSSRGALVKCGYGSFLVSTLVSLSGLAVTFLPRSVKSNDLIAFNNLI